MRPRLSPSQALELSDHLSTMNDAADPAEPYTRAHITYAIRAARALTDNDLRAALRHAEIAAVARWYAERLTLSGSRSGAGSSVCVTDASESRGPATRDQDPQHRRPYSLTGPVSPLPPTANRPVRATP